MPLCHVAARIKIVRRSKKKLDMTSATKPRQSVKQFDVVRTTGSVDGGPHQSHPLTHLGHETYITILHMNQLAGIRSDFPHGQIPMLCRSFNLGVTSCCRTICLFYHLMKYSGPRSYGAGHVARRYIAEYPGPELLVL